MSHGRGFFSDGGQAAEAASFWPNPRDREAEWGPAASDVRHNLKVAGILELPIGRDRKWANTLASPFELLLGGWTLSGVWNVHTGLPVTITAPDVSQTGARSGRPDCIGNPEGRDGVGPGTWWFNKSAFALPRLGTFGNCGVGTVRGPGFNVVDLAASKRVRFLGSAGLEFRADIFNALNTPVFNSPDRSLTSGTFGQVLSAQLAREVQLSAKVSF
jgi:hypothetical protein